MNIKNGCCLWHTVHNFMTPNSKETETPISTKNFIDSIEYRSRELGRLIGVDYAEGFTVERLCCC